MDRLTCVINGNYCADWYSTYAMEMSDKVSKIIQRLGEYEDLDEQGLLLKLPCKVGDAIYRFWYTNGKPYRIQYQRVRTLSHLASIVESGELGKSIFLTYDEAEKALDDILEKERHLNEQGS